MIRRFLCFLGFHKTELVSDGWRRCKHCGHHSFMPNPFGGL